MKPGSKHNSSISAAWLDGKLPMERGPRVGICSGGGRRHSLADKLAARTTKDPISGCWNCAGSPNRSGHVKLAFGSTQKGDFGRIAAHIYAWEQAHGQTVPDGKVIMHTCDNPRCVNPAHLKLGTQRDNVLDSIQKGRYNAFGRQKLNAAQVREIRARAAAGERQKDIAADYGIRRHTVSGIVNRKSWTHVGPFADSGGLVLERVPSVQLEIRGEVA